jgi:hypothetical protein
MTAACLSCMCVTKLLRLGICVTESRGESTVDKEWHHPLWRKQKSGYSESPPRGAAGTLTVDRNDWRKEIVMRRSTVTWKGGQEKAVEWWLTLTELTSQHKSSRRNLWSSFPLKCFKPCGDVSKSYKLIITKCSGSHFSLLLVDHHYTRFVRYNFSTYIVAVAVIINITKNISFRCMIWGSHSGGYEEFYLLGLNAM